MAARGDRAAEYARGDAHAGIAAGHCCGGQQCAGGDANKGLRGVPHRIKAGNFIGEKLHQKHEARCTHHPRVAQCLQIGGQGVDAELLQQAQKKHYGVKPHAAGPAESGGGC